MDDTTGAGQVTAPEARNSRVRLRIDQRDMTTHYVNAFRTNAAGDEVVLEVGFNTLRPAGPSAPNEEQVDGEIAFEVSNRLILGYPATKRLALTLLQIVQRYEQQNGEIRIGGQQPAGG